MHPNPAFRDAGSGDGGLLDAAAAIGLAHIFVGLPAPMVVHAPVTRHGDTLRFHVARSNRIAAHLDGAAVLASVQGDHGYISAGWYAPGPDQVPTWNYRAIEIEGRCTALDPPALIEQLDALAAAHEPRTNPAAPWTRAKMAPGPLAAMLRAIRGFEIAVTAVRATAKLSQNRTAADRAGVVAGLRAIGDHPLATAVTAAATRAAIAAAGGAAGEPADA